MPDDTGTFYLDADASNFAIGAVLSQLQDSEERVIAYASKKMSRQQLNYCTTRKELLAVYHFIRYFRHYLLGRAFIVRTDHSALQWLRRTPEPIGQQARWLEVLEEFDFQIIHLPGLSTLTLTACRGDLAGHATAPAVSNLTMKRSMFAE